MYVLFVTPINQICIEIHQPTSNHDPRSSPSRIDRPASSQLIIMSPNLSSRSTSPDGEYVECSPSGDDRASVMLHLNSLGSGPSAPISSYASRVSEPVVF